MLAIVTLLLGVAMLVLSWRSKSTAGEEAWANVTGTTAGASSDLADSSTSVVGTAAEALAALEAWVHAKVCAKVTSGTPTLPYDSVHGVFC